MNGSNFSFKPHLETAHQYWSSILTKGDLAIDATCGNGHDTARLATLAKIVYAFDIQSEAINATKQKGMGNVVFYQQCHSTFPSEIAPASIKLIVYNLGYLPGGDKNITTMSSTTLESLNRACALLCPGGMISVTCYPGHEEGRIEEELVLNWAKHLGPEQWLCCHHRWINKERSPSLLCVVRRSNTSKV